MKLASATSVSQTAPRDHSLPYPGGANALLLLLLGVVLVRGLLYATLNPAFGSPDERDHLQFVAYLATGGAAGPAGEESHQPLGYYALMVPVYWLTAGQTVAVRLLAIRLASLPFLVGTTLFTWLAARRMAPSRPVVPMIAGAFVALHPQLAYIGASANNDGAANFMAAVLTYLTVTLLSDSGARWTSPVTAVAIGAALLTKGQILPVAAVAGAVLVGHLTWAGSASGRRRLLLYAAIPLLLVGALLSGRSGERMLEVAATSGSVVMDLPKTWAVAQNAGLQPLSYLLTSFWSAFIGESVHPADGWYFLPSAIVLLGAAGYVARAVFRGKDERITRSAVLLRVALVVMLAAVMLTAYLRYLYNLQIPDLPWKLQILQGRFLHVAMAPVALLVAEGWSFLARFRAKNPSDNHEGTKTPSSPGSMSSPSWCLRVLVLSPRTGYETAVVWVPLAALALFDLVSLATLVGYYQWPW